MSVACGIDCDGAWLWQRARLTPNAAALSFARGGQESSVLTCAQLAQESATLALRLLSLGIARGDRVAVRMASHPRLVALLHAAQRIGAVLVPLNTRLPASELAPLIRHADPRLLLVDPALPLAGSLRDLPPDMRCMNVHDELDGVHVAKSAAARFDIDPQAPWMIVYTSGTTAMPKGVVLTNANHFASATASRQRLGHGCDDVWLATLPLYHVGGLAILARAVLDGSRVDLEDGFDVSRVRGAIENGPATMISLVPTMLARLLEEPLRAHPKLRCLLIGGAALSPALAARALDDGLPIAATYGLSEACSQVSTTYPGSADAAGGSVGLPLSGIELRIDAPADDGVGEMLIRGANVTSGYFRNDEANAAAFVAPAPLGEGSPAGRWFRTGDLASVDDHGRVFVSGRRSDLIVTGGENVSPAQVEAVLEEHPAVCECAVFGIDDAEWGQRVVALVALRPGCTFDAATITGELSAWCRGRLAAYKVPRLVRIVSGLARNASGKIDRRALAGTWKKAAKKSRS